MYMEKDGKVIGFKNLKYKNIVFDEWTEDEHGTWATICKSCLRVHNKRLDLEIDRHGSGDCSVRGCWEADGDEVDIRYIDFDINSVEIFEESFEELINKLKALGIDYEELTHELDYRHNCDDKGPGGWNDDLHEYTFEELEMLEQNWEK